MGLEIVPDAVRWCQQTYRDYPHFRFVHADVYNRWYHPHGRIQPIGYRFPFAEGTFDFIVATSLFTHMRPADVVHYLQEIQRCLKPTGRVFLTVYSVDTLTREAIVAGRTQDRWVPLGDGSYTTHPQTPELALAHAEDFWQQALQRAALQLCEPIMYSHGGPRTSLLTQQDILVVAHAGV